MTREEAIAAFAAASDAPPDDAIRWCLEYWADAAPHFRTMLRDYASGDDTSETTTDAMFFLVHLFGDRGETAAFVDLCRLMRNEQRLVDALGDDATVSTLKGVLIKCFDGDAAPLRAVVEDPEAESITRGEALLALAWLARDGRTPEQDFKVWLTGLYQTLTPKQEDFIWYALVLTAALLGYRDLDDASRRLMRRRLIPQDWLTGAELEDLLDSGDPVGKDGLLAEEVAPFDDIIGTFAEWRWDETDDDESDEDEPAPEPYINPLRHVGRNDPCPCGSGKKFKNCHLAAD